MKKREPATVGFPPSWPLRVERGDGSVSSNDQSTRRPRLTLNKGPAGDQCGVLRGGHAEPLELDPWSGSAHRHRPE